MNSLDKLAIGVFGSIATFGTGLVIYELTKYHNADAMTGIIAVWPLMRIWDIYRNNLENNKNFMINLEE